MDDSNVSGKWKKQLKELLYGLGALASSILMALLYAVAFTEIGRSVYIFFGPSRIHENNIASESQAMVTALKGIEYLFLAPMSFIVYRSLSRYVLWRNSENSSVNAETEVMEAKRLVTGLMVAVVATDMIGSVLSPSPLRGLSPLYELGLLVVLAGYTFLLKA